MTYIVYKTFAGNKKYLAPSGKWVKTARLGAAYSREDAQAKAAEVGGWFRVYSFRG